MEDENEYLKLPVEERCVHKLWKARVSGYEEALKLFNQFDGDDSNWKKVIFRLQLRKCIFYSRQLSLNMVSWFYKNEFQAVWF